MVILMDKKITVTYDEKRIAADASLTLSEIVGGERPCGGHGRCGKCKIKAHGELSPITDRERQMLTEYEISRGIRLACLTYPIGDCTVEALSDFDSQVLTDGEIPEIELVPTFSSYGVAIDIGTTTLAARLYSNGGIPLASVSGLNPQSKWGADVVSRIEAALSGNAKVLAEAIKKATDDIIKELAFAAKIDTDSIDGVCITGNTVMLALLTENSVLPFSHAPFDVKELYGVSITAEELGLKNLNGGVPVYIPPCISAFVGADITCAILASGLLDCESAVLADIGTNGEMALFHNGELKVCSTAAGPAFEGVGIKHGMRGAEGAIDKVDIYDGALNAHVIGDVAPRGICGSGLIDAVACMLNEGVLDESGYLEEDFTLFPPVTIIPKDIRNLQLAKSAICAGLITLLDTEALKAENVDTFYIAGGFGNYLNIENAKKIGLLPKDLCKNVRNVGNAALAGASMMLLNVNARDKAQALLKEAKTVNLSVNPVFAEQYMSCMMFFEI